jgi:hypothetical protein
MKKICCSCPHLLSSRALDTLREQLVEFEMWQKMVLKDLEFKTKENEQLKEEKKEVVLGLEKILATLKVICYGSIIEQKEKLALLAKNSFDISVAKNQGNGLQSDAKEPRGTGE